MAQRGSQTKSTVSRGGFAGAVKTAPVVRTAYYLAAVALALLVPLTLLAGLWVRSEFLRIENNLVEYVATRAGALSQRIDGELKQQFGVLKALGALPSLDSEDLPRFQEEATRVVSAVPDWAFVSLLDAGGTHELLNTLRPAGAPRDQPPLSERVKGAMRNGQPILETRDPGIAPGYDGRAVLLYVPVFRDGNLRHVLRAGLKADLVQELLREESLDAELLSLVIDERGHVIARSRQIEQFVGQPAHEGLRQAIGSLSVGRFVTQALDGQDVFTAFQRSALTGWVAVAATDRSHIDRMSQRLTWAALATSALSLALAGTLGAFLFYNLVQRRVTRDREAASNALIALDARLLATTQDALAVQRKAASEREVLLREIYHRVKNNLQIIQSLLRLGSHRLSALQREPFEAAIRRIGAMARVHTLLYNSPELESIELKDYLDGIAVEIADAHGAEERGIATVLKADPMRIPLDTAVPLAFIAVELLTNAYKHAFPGRGGAVTVEAYRDGERGVLAIADDGVGFAPAGREKRSLGLTIVAKLTQQIDGEFTQPEGPGARFVVTFSLARAAAAAPPPKGSVAG